MACFTEFVVKVTRDHIKKHKLAQKNSIKCGVRNLLGKKNCHSKQ